MAALMVRIEILLKYYYLEYTDNFFKYVKYRNVRLKGFSNYNTDY